MWNSTNSLSAQELAHITELAEERDRWVNHAAMVYHGCFPLRATPPSLLRSSYTLMGAYEKLQPKYHRSEFTRRNLKYYLGGKNGEPSSNHV